MLESTSRKVLKKEQKWKLKKKVVFLLSVAIVVFVALRRFLISFSKQQKSVQGMFNSCWQIKNRKKSEEFRPQTKKDKAKLSDVKTLFFLPFFLQCVVEVKPQKQKEGIIFSLFTTLKPTPTLKNVERSLSSMVEHW